MLLADLKSNLEIAEHIMVAYEFKTPNKSYSSHTTYFSTTKADIEQAIVCWEKSGINEISAHLVKPHNILYIGEDL